MGIINPKGLKPLVIISIALPFWQAGSYGAGNSDIPNQKLHFSPIILNSSLLIFHSSLPTFPIPHPTFHFRNKGMFRCAQHDEGFISRSDIKFKNSENQGIII
jgi:hypothetical protein